MDSKQIKDDLIKLDSVRDVFMGMYWGFVGKLQSECSHEEVSWRGDFTEEKFGVEYYFTSTCKVCGYGNVLEEGDEGWLSLFGKYWEGELCE